MTNDKDSAVLEPCPFCGGEAAIGTGRNYYFVLCPDCLTSTNVVLAESIMPTEAEAIAAWNKRQPTQSDALVTALRFYAREANYRSTTVYMSGQSGKTAIGIDGGQRARTALQEQIK